MTRQLDNRGLQPPEPMVRTLEAAAQLGEGEDLEIVNDRVPVFLLPLLEEQGFDYEVHELPEGGARVRIWRKGSPPT